MGNNSNNKCVSLFLILFVHQISTLSDVDEQCVNKKTNKVLFNSELMLGQWFKVVSFTPSLDFRTEYCNRINFTKPTQEEMASYKQKYNNQSAPYNIDENPVRVKDSSTLIDGMIVGGTRAKFYLLDPKSVLGDIDGYVAQVYRPINEKFVLTYDCRLRLNFIDLLSREKIPKEEELKAAIAKVKNLKKMGRYRFCAPPLPVEKFDIEL
ncbi:uncharacterized protein LOC114356308 [Ostrinia furnacalis]|uniref:uncharacterized protein LOC114356308 n=1 Tax=Ostrinia furnacalis TaxID=93504 RepID=UPI00103992D8|nr:uncharacterized protein LOC114356308 [Ostrinia furnacalis]